MTPLLRATAAALENEAAQLDTDRLRVAEHGRQTRAALDDAFAADLDTVEAMDRRWVLEAAQAYAAAREAVTLHEHDARAALDARETNLRRAAEAQRRAIALLEQQDRLIVETVGVDVWAWVRGQAK
ncbi:MAG: hypothetical protein GVY24_03320 [Planctomycetes bacterium]|nr:hypothetical protein [Planctomycetota bacterium]